MPRRELHGIVTNTSADKTVRIKVESKVRHPIYKKYVKRTKSYLAHDETNSCQIGQAIRIEECRPISKRKTWKVIESQS